MTTLPTELRKRLENAIREARTISEKGARKALEALTVDRHEPHGSRSVDERTLRNRLRAHGRQLGDKRDPKGTQAIRRLELEIAYEHWHRMLFARFLAENDLLIEPRTQVAVTIEECEELGREQGLDTWALAASFAEGMLPQIFRANDPALAVTLPPETRQALQKLLADLPAEVFTAGDSLGWTYQFWQSAEKDTVNDRVKSGEKITGETLPAVTQIFTEPYMVQFLLHNTIGAWHAGKVLDERPELATTATSEQALRDAVALDGYAFEYLRFVREPQEGDAEGEPSGPWCPAAGTYPGWPRRASELEVLDPCCGSGHFLVAAFDLLVRLRRAEEGLETDDAIRAVLADNLFGLELDARCTQIAAFHLALGGWRMAERHITLPQLNVACSGIGPNASKEEWLSLAEEAAIPAGTGAKQDSSSQQESQLSYTLRNGLEELYESFRLAPEIGSLIDPAGLSSDLFTAGFEQIQPLLAAALTAEAVGDETHERAVAAQGMARTAEILAKPGGYTLVLTNVPYLGRGSQSDRLKTFIDVQYKEAKADLATVFLARMLSWVSKDGTVAAVTPQNWLFLTSYKKFREWLLKEHQWELVARLGHGAFETISGHVVNVVLVSMSGGRAPDGHMMAGIDVSAAAPATSKAALLKGEAVDQDADAVAQSDSGSTSVDGTIRQVFQKHQLMNPDARISLLPPKAGELLSQHCASLTGLGTGDFAKYGRRFWEFPQKPSGWSLYQGPVDETAMWGGAQHAIAWDSKHGRVRGMTDAERAQIHNQDQSGQQAWNRRGVAISLMGDLRAALYTGSPYDKATAVLVPASDTTLAALWAFCSSEEFQTAVREVDRNVMCSSGALVKVHFDLPRWQKIAAERYPNGLAEPRSDDPTQWLFHGHPAHAEAHTILQVGVARLLGYRWPAEIDPEISLASEARDLVRSCSALADHVDGDGVVCLSSVHGEGTAADRLRSLFASAFGSDWSAARERDLLEAAGERSNKSKVQRSLEEWLRDRFFEEHCALFLNRPFVWHVWDGLPDGFHALVNYHRLAGASGQGRRTLDTLTSTYLGEWIDRQRQKAAAGEEGAEGRLAAAIMLRDELRKILAGEPPFDIFVRWKPIQEQPLGWEPDLDDGVRLNVRPFLLAQDIGARGAGILRTKPDSTWSNKRKPGVKDRGREPAELRPRHLFPWFWTCEPERHPGHRIDFGAGTPGSAPAGEDFDGARWNGLHYTRAAKEAARRAAAERAAEESGA
jgi:hypothetical protein